MNMKKLLLNYGIKLRVKRGKKDVEVAIYRSEKE